MKAWKYLIGTIGLALLLTFALAQLLTASTGVFAPLEAGSITGSSLTIQGSSTFVGDVTIYPNATGGNAGVKNEGSGLWRLKQVALGTMVNGSTETTSYMDDSPAGEYTYTVTTTVTLAESTSIYRFGSKSLQVIFASDAITDAGAKRTITGDNLEGNESVGAWFYPTVALAAGDIQVLLTDNGGARTFTNTVALPATTWTWQEFDIGALAAGTGDTVTEFGVTLTGQNIATLGAFSLYLDGAWKWDADAEEALGTAILQDGVLSVMTIATAAATDNTPAMLAENTGYFVHYEPGGNDFLVTITDQSAASGVALIAY
ncbi:MAG: hypothetical protein WC718_14840 [Phycisphaerales bacterium]|jgi:hypothetical protein